MKDDGSERRNLSTIVVARDGVPTLAQTYDWAVSVALIRAAYGAAPAVNEEAEDT